MWRPCAALGARSGPAGIQGQHALGLQGLGDGVEGPAHLINSRFQNQEALSSVDDAMQVLQLSPSLL